MQSHVLSIYSVLEMSLMLTYFLLIFTKFYKQVISIVALRNLNFERLRNSCKVMLLIYGRHECLV